jgi:signal transduction histidine kinase
MDHLARNKLPLVETFVDAFLLDRLGKPVLQVHSQRPTGPASWETTRLWYGPLQAPTEVHPYLTFLISTPLISLEGDRQVGFLQILVRADNWAEHLREAGGLPAAPNFRIWLEDTVGNTLTLLPRVSGAGEGGIASPRTADTSPVIEYATTISRNGWTMQLEVDRDPVMEPIRGLLNRFLLVGGVLLLLSLMIWFFPARFLLRPLATLQDAARRIAEGDFSTRVTIDSRDEVGDLSQSFNIMAAAVEERTHKLKEAATVLKRREMDIRFERDRLNAVIGSMHDGLFILDAKGEITLSNSAAQPLVSALGQEDDRPHRLDCRYANREEADCLCCLADIDQPPQSCVVGVGSRRYEIHATPLAVADGRMVGRVFVSRDVTERIAQAERQAYQERMSVIGEIAAVMAHELNNPLAAIGMFSQMLEAGLEPGSSFREHAEVIRRNAESCKKTIRGLLDMATAGGCEVSAFDVHDLLHDVRRFLRPFYERAKIAFTLETTAGNSTVVADELQLRQVVVNLVMNAIQAAEDRPGSVTVTTLDRGDNLAILVSDSGPGIPPEGRTRIFEPFFTTKPPGVGTGLGLPTSKRIVEAHGGTLGLIASGAGRTVFEVLLPRKGHPKFRQPAAGEGGMRTEADESIPTGGGRRG